MPITPEQYRLLMSRIEVTNLKNEKLPMFGQGEWGGYAAYMIQEESIARGNGYSRHPFFAGGLELQSAD